MARNNGSVGSISMNLTLNTSNFTNGLGGIQKNLGSLSAGFSKLGGVIAAAFSVDVITKFGKSCASAFSQAETGAMKLYATLSGQGINFDTADNFISQFVSDGLVELGKAQEAYANLAQMGMDTSQIETMMQVMKDSASIGKQSGYTIGEAMATATEGMKQGLSNKTDNVGIATNLSQMEEEYKKLLGITGDLTQEQKNQAYVNGFLKEGAKYTGTASKMTQTYTGAVSALSTQFNALKVNLGSILSHILIPLIQGINNVITKINEMAATWSNRLNEMFNTKTPADFFTDTSSQITDTVANGTQAIGESASSAAKKILRAVAPFDELNKISDNSISSSGGGSSSTSGTQGTTNNNTSSNSNDTFEKSKKSFELTSGWIGRVKKEISSTFNQLKEFANAIIFIFNGVKENLGKVFSDVVDIIRIPLETAFMLISSFYNDMVSLYTEPIIQCKEKIVEFANGVLSAVGNLTEGIKGVVQRLCDNLMILYDEHIRPFFEVVKESWVEWSNIALDSWNTYINPILDRLSEKSKEVMGKLHPILDKLRGILGNLIDILAIVWKEYVTPFISFILENVVPALATLLGGFCDVSLFLEGEFLDAIDMALGFVEDFSQVIEDLVQITADVKNAIVDTFNSIPELIKSGINGTISLINGLIDSINKLSFDIPSLTGEDKHIGFNIKHIPMLANGGYVGPNSPQLAVIGDNRHYGEVVANDKQLENLGNTIINGVVGALGSVSGNNQPIYLSVQIGEDDFTDVVATSINQYAKRTGKRIM